MEPLSLSAFTWMGSGVKLRLSGFHCKHSKLEVLNMWVMTLLWAEQPFQRIPLTKTIEKHRDLCFIL